MSVAGTAAMVYVLNSGGYIDAGTGGGQDPQGKWKKVIGAFFAIVFVLLLILPFL